MENKLIKERTIFVFIKTKFALLLPILLYIVVAAFSIQLIYWLVCFIAILRHRSQQEQKREPVSIIVCAHNELENLKTLIPKLSEQDHPAFEIIIIDDRSDDGTYDYLLGIKDDKIKVVTVDKVHDHINAKKYAITLGVRAARYDMLLFTDADCEPNSSHWASQMSMSFSSDTNFVLGYSPYKGAGGFLYQFIRFETLWTAINYLGFALAGNPYMAVGRNLAYRKSAFLENKGFNKFQHITGGDDDLLVNQQAGKKNTRVVIGEDTLIYSYPEKSWGAYVHQKIRHLSVSKYYRFKDKFLLGMQSLAHTIFWVALISLAAQSDQYSILAGVFVARLFFILNLTYFTSKKLGDRINVWLVPLMDLLYVFYIVIFGIRAIFTRKVQWKK